MQVIQFDLPKDMETYIARSGRTGRSGHVGTAVAYVDPHADRLLLPGIVNVSVCALFVDNECTGPAFH